MATTVSALEFVRGFQRTTNQIASHRRNRQVSLCLQHRHQRKAKDAALVIHRELGHSARRSMRSTVALQLMNALGFSAMIHILMNALRRPQSHRLCRLVNRRTMLMDVALERITTFIHIHSAPNSITVTIARWHRFVIGLQAMMLNVSHQLNHHPRRRLQHQLRVQFQDAVMVMLRMVPSASAWKMNDHVVEHQIVIGKKPMITRCANHQHRHQRRARRPLQHLCMRRDAVPDIHREHIHSAVTSQRERNARAQECVRGLKLVILMIAF